MDTTINRQRVAYHEAGHAVMTLLLLGSPDHLRCVTNLKLGPEIEGISYASPVASRLDTFDMKTVLETQVLIVQAGMFAERFFLDEHFVIDDDNVWWDPGEGINEVFGPLLKLFRLDRDGFLLDDDDYDDDDDISDEECDLELKGVEILQQILEIRLQKIIEANWEAIERVARAMMKHRVLTGNEVAALMANEPIQIKGRRNLSFVEQIAGVNHNNGLLFGSS